MMIRTEHLSKSYGEKEAVCDLTLEIRRGEIFGPVSYTHLDVYKRQVQETTKYSLPLFIAIMATLAICVFFPDLVLFLPNMIYGTSM